MKEARKRSEPVMVYRGTYKNGVIVLDQPVDLVEGQAVSVLIETNQPGRPDTATQALLELAGAIKDGPPDASVNHDHYIYGAPKRDPEA